METYFSLVFRNTRSKLGCNENDFARLLEIEECELWLIENCQLFPDANTLYKLEQLTNEDLDMISMMY